MIALYLKTFFNKNRFKKTFRLLLAISICFTSSPIYSNDIPNFEEFSRQMTEHRPHIDVQITYEKILNFKRFIQQMEKHQLKGTFNEFAKQNYQESRHPEHNELLNFDSTVQDHLQYGIYRDRQFFPDQQIIAIIIQNPSFLTAIDYFMIEDQEVHLIENNFDENSQQPTAQVRDKILINDFRVHPNTSAITQINTFYSPRPKGSLNKAVQEEDPFFLEGEGKIPGEAIVRHYIPRLNNVVSHAEDGEFIVLFDPRRKKLLLIDKIYAGKHLGSAPIYIMQIPIDLTPQIDQIGENLSIDFVQRRNKSPVDVISPDVKRNMEHFFQDNEPKFSLGDVLLTYINSEGQRELIQYISRNELYRTMNKAYTVVNSMIFRHSADSLFQDQDNSSMRDYAHTLYNTHSDNKDIYSEGFFRNLHNTFSLFLRPALHKSIPAQGLIQLRIEKSIPENIKERQLFTKENWPTEKTSEEKKLRFVQLLTDRLAHPFKKGPYITMALMIYALSLAFPETFSTLLDFISNASTNYNVQQNLSSTSSLAIEHLILFTFIAIGLLKSAMWAGYKLPPLIASKFPNKGELGRYKKRAQMALERIKKQKEKYQKEDVSLTKNWLTLFGNKAGYLMPAFYRLLPRIVGQPLFFHTLEQGLNPFSQIQTEDGRTVRIGITPYRFTKRSKVITDHLDLQDEFIEKLKRLKGVATQLANIALMAVHSNRDQKSVNPHDIVTWGPGFLQIISEYDQFLKDLEKKDLEKSLKKKYYLQQQWVVSRLIAKMRETKLYNQIDFSQSNYIDQEYLDKFYKRAQYFVFAYEKNSKMLDRLYKGAKELIQDYSSSPEESSALYERAVEFVQEYEKNESNEVTLQLYQKAQALVQEYQKSHKTDRSIQKYSKNSLEDRHRIYMWAKNKYQIVRNAVVFWNKENVRYLTKGIHNANISLITSRWISDFMSDQAVSAVTPYFFGSRSQPYFGNMHLFAADSETFGGASTLQNSDMLSNTAAWQSTAVPQTSLLYSLEELDSKIQNTIEKYKTELPDKDLEKKLSNFSQLWRYFIDPLKSGGKTDNFGHLLSKKAWTSWHLIQPTLLFFIIARFFTDQTLGDILISAPIFTAGALWVYRWLWVWIATAHKMTDNEFTKNTKRMTYIQLKLNLLEKALFSSQKEFTETVQQVFPEFIHLYEKEANWIRDQIANMEGLSNKPLIEKLLFEKNTDRASLTNSDIEDIKQASQKLGEILVQKTPLPTQRNNFADQVFSLIIAILTTVFALQLADEAFADENLNFRNFLKHLIISAGGAVVAFKLFQRGLIKDGEDGTPSFRTLSEQKAGDVKIWQIWKPKKSLEAGTVKLIDIGSNVSTALRGGISRISQRPEKTTSKTKNAINKGLEKTKLDQIPKGLEWIETKGQKADEYLAKKGNNLVNTCKKAISKLKRR